MRHSTILYVIILTFVTGVGMAQIDFEKYPANPVLELGDDGSWDDVHISHPSVLFDGSTYHLWYVGDNGSLRGIGYARSNNGVVWEKYPGNPLLTDGLGDVWDGDFVSQPSVLYDGTQYCMWYAGYDGNNLRIGYATSDDGIVWNKYASNPVLELGDGGLWDAMGVSSPTVMYDGTQYQMWYAGYDGSSLRIGYATSTDGVVWNKDAENPVLDLGDSGLWDAMGVSSPTVVYDGTQYQIWYTGYDGSSLRIGYATSTDGVVWNKDAENPILELGQSNSWDSMGVSGPTIVVLGAEDFRMWYTGYDGTNMRIGFSYLGCPDAGSGEPLARPTTHAHANPAIYEATSENGAEVTIDGSQSIGSDGNPIVDENAYEWDFDYDGDFQPEAIGKVVTYVYPIGEYTAALRVTDSSESNIDTVNIKVQDTSPPIVKLLTPYGGEVYQGGGAVTIRWEPATDVVSLQNNAIALYYNSDGGDWQLIVQNEANNGQYDWTAPVLDSDNIKVKIEATDAAGNVGSDTPAVEFTIDSQAPVVGLITPNGSEVLGGGSLFPITWQPATDNLGLTDAPISLSYSADDGANWELIAEGEGNDGQFDWNIPALDSEGVLMRIQAVDRAGNVGADISSNFVIDSSKPEPPALTPIDSPTLENVLTIEGTTEATAGEDAPLTQVNLFDNGSLMGTVQAGADGSFSFLTPTLSDRTHSFTATATDAAGNVSDASTAVDVLVDTVTPKRPIPLSPADGIVLNVPPTLVWEVVSDAMAVSYCVKVDDEQNFASPEVDVSEIAETQFSPTLPDGLWFWQIQARDAVGHESELSPIFQFSLDTVAPDSPIIASPEAEAIVSETSLTISGTAEPKSHIDISDNEQPFGSIVADVGGRFALVIEAFTEGDHTLTAKATDAAGNESETSQHSFSVDNTAPTVTLTYPNGGELFRGGDSIDITWTGVVDAHLADNPISLFYSLAGLAGWIPIAENEPDDGSYTWNIPQVNSQVVRVKIIAADVAGNVGEYVSDASFTIDSDAPVSSLTIIAPNKEQTQYLRGGSTYTIVWSLPQDNFELADVALCYSTDGGNTWHSIDSVIDSGTIYGQYDWNVPMIDSNQVIIRIEATDVSGNMAEYMSENHVIDSSAPEAPVLTPIDSPTAQNVLTLTGTAEAFSQVSLLRNENQIASIQADASGNFSFTTAPLADGLHSFTATATDVAGNISSASVPVDVIVDTLAPNKPIIVSPESGTILSGTAITISGTAEPESRVDVYDNEQMIGFDITDADGGFELSYQEFDAGEHTLTAIATDAAGNASEISESVTLIVVDLVLIAQFTWAPEPQDEGAPVQFTNTSTSSPDEIVSFSWDFGDENTSSEENPSHAYGDNSTYTVTLTVATAGGSTDTVSHDMTVNNVEPVVEAGSDQTADKGYEVVCDSSFTDQGWLDTHTATIDWGDGIVEPGNVIEQEGSGTVSGNHTYTDYGLYTVTVGVTDDDGASNSDTFKVTVLPAAFNYALFGNTGKLAIKTWATVSGDVFNHGDVEVKEEAVIDGLLFSTEEVTGQGTYTLGELPEPLPELPVLDTTPYELKLSEASFQLESDLISDSIDLVGETILVNGEVVLTASGNITGPGVIVATKNIQIKEDSNIGEGIILIAGGNIVINERVVSATSLDNSFFSEEGIEIKKESQIAGVLLSLGKVEMKEHTIFSGIVYATGTVKIKAESEIEGSVVAHKLKEINEGASVTYNEATAQELSTKIFIEGEELSQAPVAFVLTKFIQRETKLAQNYPNPFNPETWIPYQLAKDADVIIEIYNISGQLTRTLYLGNQNAGNYFSKDEAAYWDGRNELGEPVASGLYFYLLKTENFTATRRMVLLR